MTKYAKDIVKGDIIILDCGYGLNEDWSPCKVLDIDKPIPLFENDRSEDYISFYVEGDNKKFYTHGYSPFYNVTLA